MSKTTADLHVARLNFTATIPQTEECATCSGGGIVRVIGNGVLPLWQACEFCNGSGRIVDSAPVARCTARARIGAGISSRCLLEPHGDTEHVF